MNDIGKVFENAPQTQSLLLDDSLFPEVRNGKKTVTIRKGDRDIKEGSLLLLPTNETCKGEKVLVNRVVKCNFRQIPNDLLEKDFGFMSHYDALQEMKKFYPDLTEDDVMTVVEWEGVMKPYVVFEKMEMSYIQPELSPTFEDTTEPTPPTPKMTIRMPFLIERADGFYTQHEQKYERYQIIKFFNEETGNFQDWPEYDEERCIKDA